MVTKSVTGMSRDIVLRASAASMPNHDELVCVPTPEARQQEIELNTRVGVLRRPCRWLLFNVHYVELPSGQVINLAFLGARPPTLRDWRWPWLGVCLLALVAAVALAYIGQWLELMVAALASVSCLLVFLLTARQRWVFRTRHGGLAVLEISTSLFAGHAAMQFVKLLATRIQTASKSLPQGELRLAVEMAEHRRLLHIGCLTADRYQLAKQRIFAHYKK